MQWVVSIRETVLLYVIFFLICQDNEKYVLVVWLLVSLADYDVTRESFSTYVS